MLNNVIKKILVGSIVLIFPSLSFAFADLSVYKKTEFSPERKERFSIPFALQEKSQINIKIYTVDGDLVRTLKSDKALKKGSHQLHWDGKDEKDVVVPDEVYIPVLEATNDKGEKHQIDPRKTSGGETVDDIKVNITADRNIAYVLPAPSRVLIRAGIKGGPLMRSIANWQPRSAGKNIQHWDGKDENKVIDLRTEDGLKVLVIAFQLPHHAIITIGNKKIDYSEYRQQNNWPDRMVKPDEMTLARGTQAISRQHYVSPAQAGNPTVKLSFPEQQKKNKAGFPVFKAGERVHVKVDVDEKDRWLIDQSLYEVAFFVDHEFVSEEEQGYIPLSWIWTVGKLKPEQHAFTVNISGFGGKVGVVSTLFEIEK